MRDFNHQNVKRDVWIIERSTAAVWQRLSPVDFRSRQPTFPSALLEDLLVRYVGAVSRGSHFCNDVTTIHYSDDLACFCGPNVSIKVLPESFDIHRAHAGK